MNTAQTLVLQWPTFSKLASPLLEHADAYVYGSLPLKEFIPTPRGETLYFSNTWVAINETEFKRRALAELTSRIDELWEDLVEHHQQAA